MSSRIEAVGSQADPQLASANLEGVSIRNRYGTALAALCAQICLGTVYGWSVFKNPLMASEHWAETPLQWTFTIAFVVNGVGCVVGGWWQDKIGPRKVATFAALSYGAGYLLSGVAVSNHTLTGLYMAYGVLVGLGTGMGYIASTTMLLKWFPDHRGRMSGLAACGFGLGALIMSPVAAWEVVNYGVPKTFETLGVAYLLVIFTAAQFFSRPPVGWRPAGWEPRTAVAKAAVTNDYTLPEAFAIWQFYLLFLLQFMSVLAGIMVISQASPMAQELAGMTVLRAAGMVGLISIFNGIGRFFWASVSDYLGRARVYLAVFLLQALMLFSLPHVHDWALFTAMFAVIGLCYGGGIGTVPSFSADYFGEKSIGAIYGVIVFGGSLASILSPILAARVHEKFGTYAPAANIVAVAMLCALVLPLIARPPQSVGKR